MKSTKLLRHFLEPWELILKLMPTLKDIEHFEVALLLIEVMRARLCADTATKRRATIVTTNLAFAEWVTVFAGDES